MLPWRSSRKTWTVSYTHLSFPEFFFVNLLARSRDEGNGKSGPFLNGVLIDQDCRGNYVRVVFRHEVGAVEHFHARCDFKEYRFDAASVFLTWHFYQVAAVRLVVSRAGSIFVVAFKYFGLIEKRHSELCRFKGMCQRVGDCLLYTSRCV